MGPKISGEVHVPREDRKNPATAWPLSHSFHPRLLLCPRLFPGVDHQPGAGGHRNHQRNRYRSQRRKRQGSGRHADQHRPRTGRPYPHHQRRGFYTGTTLPLGTYTVKISAPGFNTASITQLVLHVNDALTLNRSLVVGSADQQVSVKADAVQLNFQDATSATLISGTQVRELALNNRNYEQLVALQPGVSYGGGDQLYIGLSNPSGETNAVSFSVNGNRNSANNWTLDGADNVDRGSNLTLLAYPSVDAIAEFKTLRGNSRRSTDAAPAARSTSSPNPAPTSFMVGPTSSTATTSSTRIPTSTNSTG